MTYFKPERSPQLLAKDISATDDPRLPMTGAEFLAKAWRLANAQPVAELRVEVQGDSIIVTMPGTDFSVTYEKSADTHHLMLTHSWISETVTTLAVSKFRARAFQAAVEKARELGWIK